MILNHQINTLRHVQPTTKITFSPFSPLEMPLTGSMCYKLRHYSFKETFLGVGSGQVSLPRIDPIKVTDGVETGVLHFIMGEGVLP